MAPNERVFPAVQEVIGSGRILPAPASFYVTGEDWLRIVSVNSKTTVAVQLHWRLTDSQGHIVANRVDHVPNTDRTVKTSEHPLGVGQLLNLTIFANSGAPQIGQTYVMVQLVRGAGAAAIVLGTLLGGYVTGTQALGFPGSPIVSSIEGPGYLRSLTGTTPAVGAEISETVPTGARWELVAGRFLFTTVAGGANRWPLIAFSNGTFDYFRSPGQASVAPSDSRNFYWAQGMPLASVIDGSTYVAGLPTTPTLLSGYTVKSSTQNMAAGDSYAAPFLVIRELLEVT